MKLLSINHLSKRYKEVFAVNDVSFSLNRDKCIALIGPNGAGKTTILRMIAGTLKPTSGQISFVGQNKVIDRRELIGYLPQHPVFPGWMTGQEFLVYSGRLAHLSKQEALNRAERLLKKVGIDDARNRRIVQYSGGMKQRLGIAQAMIHQPKLLMLDEPVSALDPLGRRDVLTLMEQLKEEMTILFSTHILADADEVSDELLLLHQGELVEKGSLENLRNKYETTAIELEFSGKSDLFLPMIEQLSSVQSLTMKRQSIHLIVNNIQIARRELLDLIVKNDWPLMNFQINRASLEDMFMKVVRHESVDDIATKRTTGKLAKL